MKQMTFVTAMKDYFGLRPGTDNMSFLKEMQALDTKDKDWFKANLATVGYEIVTH